MGIRLLVCLRLDCKEAGGTPGSLGTLSQPLPVGGLRKKKIKVSSNIATMRNEGQSFFSPFTDFFKTEELLEPHLPDLSFQ